MAKITVQNTDISVVKYNEEDYISLTDMARSQLQEHIIFRWLSLKSTIEYLGEWEMLYNPDFNYFQNYTIANQIFSLIDFVTEATNTEIESFGEIKGIDVNAENIKHIANIKTRRLIKLLSSTNNIATFMRKTSRTKTSFLKKYGINAQINGNNELVLPTNNVVEPNRTLEFLNEDIFRGFITDSLYRSNSKKKDNR